MWKPRDCVGWFFFKGLWSKNCVSSCSWPRVLLLKWFSDEHIDPPLCIPSKLVRMSYLTKLKQKLLSSRFAPCHWFCTANLCCSRQQRSPSMSPGATAECRGADNRVVKTGPAAQPVGSPEPTSVCSCPQATPWGPGYEERPIYRPNITVQEWAETWKHLP